MQKLNCPVVDTAAAVWKIFGFYSFPAEPLFNIQEHGCENVNIPAVETRDIEVFWQVFCGRNKLGDIAVNFLEQHKAVSDKQGSVRSAELAENEVNLLPGASVVVKVECVEVV